MKSPRIFLALSLAGLGLATAPWQAMANGQAQTPRRSIDPPVRSTGKLGQDLFLAIDHRDTQAVEALLRQGADPNAKNGLEMTPIYIAAASHQDEVVQALLRAGADPNYKSTYGAPLTFAAATANLESANRLLDLKVNPNVRRSDGTTPLMMAANAGHPLVVANLLKRGADVNATNVSDSTALTYAARNGNTAAGEVLLGAGAKIDPVDELGQTPLMAAAATGRAEFVRMLLGKGAKVNRLDRERNSALSLCAKYSGDVDVAKALLGAGADPNTKDDKGMTAADYASARDYREMARLLGASPNGLSMPSPKLAATKSLHALEKSMEEFSRKTACLSCHQEGLGRVATGIAKTHGFKLNPTVGQLQGTRIREALMAMRPLHEAALKSPEAMKQVPLIEMNEVSTLDGWLLYGMSVQGDRPTPGSAAMAMVLAKQQSPNGSWTFSVPRVPMQSSNFTFTALAVRSLATFAPESAKSEIEKRLSQAKGWLMTTPAQTGDDRNFRLLGLRWAGASLGERRSAIADVLKSQNPDGGWSQTAGMPSDAYATGQALYALKHGGGIASSDAPYKRGVRYLLRTQDRDGTWFVSKRALPANNYFDAGFPHGESQYSSFNATCWAMIALLESLQ